MKYDCDILVIGAGLIGSAAARHAAETGASVVLIGAAEPHDPESHKGVFASHYDEGRLTRSLDRSPVWAELARRSMERYGPLEDLSGINFHERRGYLRIDPPGSQAIKEVSLVEREIGGSFETLGPDELKSRFPDFRFPSGYTGMLERGLAGIINPRSLVEAQHAGMRLNGGRLIRHLVREVDRSDDCFRVETPDGSVRARRMLVATGAFSGLIPLTPVPAKLRLAVETVWLARVTPDEVSRMTTHPELPAFWYEFDWHETIPHIYLLPPIRYPDGNWYLKLGADQDSGVPLDSLEDVQRFFARGGTASRAAELREVLHRVMPDLSLDQGMAKPCILTYTGHGRPYIHRFPDGSVLAAGGNGAGAKSSDEIGRLASRSALGLDDDPVLPSALFEIEND